MEKRSISRVINIIVEVTKKWVASKNKCRAHMRSVMIIGEPSKKQRSGENWQISFSANDVEIMVDNGNNPIFISFIIDNYLVKRILVDDGSAVEVLIYDAFKNMSLDKSFIRPVGPIYGFSNQLVKVKDLITILITLGQWENTITK